MAAFSGEISFADMLEPDDFIGAGVLLAEDGRFLCGIRPLRWEDGWPIVQLTAIGGGMEPYDCSLVAGVQRECLEEMRCAIRVHPCAETLVVLGPAQVERRRLADPIGPASVIFRHWHTPPGDPWRVPHDGRQCLILFAGSLVGTPRPSPELPGLIWLRPEQLVATALTPMTLAALLVGGAELLEDPALPLPRTACARLTDSQEALVLALGPAAVSFYEGLAAALSG